VTPLSGSASSFDPATGATIDLPVHNDQFRADKDGVTLSVRASRVTDSGSVDTDVWARPTPVFLPLIAAGALLGLIAGRMLAAAGAYRLQRARRRRPAAALSALAVAALCLSIVRAFHYAGGFSPVYTVYSALRPGPYLPFGPSWLILVLAVAGLVLAATAVLVARPGTPVPAAG